MALLMEFLCLLPKILQVTDALLDRHSNPRQFLGANASTDRKLPDMLVKAIYSLLFGKLTENEKKHDVVGKDDDLPCFGFFGEAAGHVLTPFVVEGRYGIVKQDSGRIFSGAEFSEEGGN